MSRFSVAILKCNKQLSMSKDNTPFRVLAIDGGGARGIFPAHILSLISQELERDLGSVFDLTVGTSTGAIIAAAVATRVPAEQIVELYESRAREIFAGQRLALRGLLRSQYRSGALRRVLTEVFGQRTMADVPGRLILPATDASNGNVFIIKSPYRDDFVRDAPIALVDAIMASCAAPGYFDPVRIREYLLADGGLWCNDPSIVAYIEATAQLQIAPQNVRILSLGTGSGRQFYDVNRSRQIWGLATGWGGIRLVKTILNLQSRASMNAAELLLGDNYMRISFEDAGASPLDDFRKMPALKARAGEAFTYKWQEMRQFLAV